MHGDIQTFMASVGALLFTIVNSNWWTAGIAILSALVLIFRLYREITEIMKRK